MSWKFRRIILLAILIMNTNNDEYEEKKCNKIIFSIFLMIIKKNFL